MSHGPTNNQQIFDYYFWSTYWVRAARKDQLNNMAIVIHVFHLSFEVRGSSNGLLIRMYFTARWCLPNKANVKREERIEETELAHRRAWKIFRIRLRIWFLTVMSSIDAAAITPFEIVFYNPNSSQFGLQSPPKNSMMAQAVPYTIIKSISISINENPTLCVLFIVLTLRQTNISFYSLPK